jgi:hypothetical protein
MTKITNSTQSHKSSRKYKSEMGVHGPLKEALSVSWRKMKYSRFFSMYIVNKVMQVCLITALIVKRHKRKNYSYVIILLNVWLI